MARVRCYRRLLPLLLVALAMTVFAAACGGDDEDTSASAPSDGSTSTSSPAAREPAGSEPTEIEVLHFSGTDTVPVHPETVVVFDLGVFLSLHALGVEVDALGGLNAPIPNEYAEAVEKATAAKIGTAFEPDYEAVNALEPDLIIVAGRSSATYPEMKKIAPTIDLTLDNAAFLDSFRDRHEILGRIFSVEDKVAAELEKLEREIEDVASKAPQAGTTLFLMANGAEISAYGPGSRFGLVHDLFGFPAAESSLDQEATHGDVVSFEFVLDAAPELLLVLDRAAAIGQEGDAAEKILDNPLVAQTPAWQNNRVVYVDGFAWYLAPNSFPAMYQMIEDLRAGLP